MNSWNVTSHGRRRYNVSLLLSAFQRSTQALSGAFVFIHSLILSWTRYNTCVELSYLQILWLRSRGGRTVEDAFIKNGKYFCSMWPNRLVQVPDDSDIDLYEQDNGYVVSHRLKKTEAVPVKELPNIMNVKGHY